MASFKIDAGQLDRLANSFRRAGADLKRGEKRFLKKLGVIVQGLSRKYCPESPTKAMYARMNKSGKTKRKSSGITTGQLRDSIRHDVTKTEVSINVPANSRGGKYAKKIHDEKGQTWRNRGVRTREKGSKADEKFIYRAAKDSKKEIDGLIDQVIDEFTKEIGI